MEVPRVFYKYRSLAGEDREYVRDTITNGNIRLANPSSFNDPFDCAPAFAPTLTPDGAYALARRYLSREHPRWSEEKLELAARAFTLQTGRADMSVVAQGLRDNYEFVREWLAVYCVSGTCTSALMWAHYSDSHRGICIGFAPDVDIFAAAQAVSYSNVRHTVDPVHDSDEQKMVNSLLLKSADWKYEQEWRYIDSEGGPGPRQVALTTIREIVLGARISPQDERRVVSWAARLQHKPQLLRAAICPNHFKVNIHPYVQT